MTSSTVRLDVSGKSPGEQMQIRLLDGQTLRIGRAPQSGWAIPWDKAISREHADLEWRDNRLRVTCLPAARNPLYHQGQSLREAQVGAGDAFEIGSTRFAVQTPSSVDDLDYLDDNDTDSFAERSFSPDDLRQVGFSNAVRQMEVLANLPRLINESQTDPEFAALVADLLLEAIPQARAVAVARYDPAELPVEITPETLAKFPRPTQMRIATRDNAASLRPSRRMIWAALTRGENVIYIWNGADAGTFTVSDGLDWAFCCPVQAASCSGWCLYVSGQGGADGPLVNEEDLAGDLRFTELVAQFIGSVRQVRVLQKQTTELSTFFSPKVIENLTGHNETLAPSEKRITVLFCDVRGFSRKSEELKHNLTKLLRSVSEALGVMANGILELDGAIADFQGDAALGFWGWPVEHPEGAIPACRAALSILEQFRLAILNSNDLLSGFSVGMGVAHGRALAGKIGTQRQSKVGVFGPVVNQGARLEGMTKVFGVPICLDEESAKQVRKQLPPSQGRCRRLARVRPAGMDVPLLVSQLLGPAKTQPEMSDTVIAQYEKALVAVIAGRWSKARKLLEELPARDGPRRFLLDRMAAYDYTPPSDWDGAFSLDAK